MKTINQFKGFLFALSFAVLLFGCSKNVPTPSSPPKPPAKPSTIYSVKVVMKWGQTVPFQAPVLYDSVKTSVWTVNNYGSPSYNVADTAINIPDWFSVYSNDTVPFCVSENGMGWQTAYTSPPFRKCRVQFLVNNVIKMDTTLSDLAPTTPPRVVFVIK